VCKGSSHDENDNMEGLAVKKEMEGKRKEKNTQEHSKLRQKELRTRVLEGGSGPIKKERSMSWGERGFAVGGNGMARRAIGRGREVG